MANEYTTEDYRETVEAIAKDILEDKGLDSDNWGDRITEDVNSNAYIIMAAGPSVVKEASDNWPTDIKEVQAMAGTVLDFYAIFAVAADMAMEQDVRDKCRDLAEDAEECDRCKKVIFADVFVACEDCEDEICDDCATQDDSGKVLCKDCGEDEDPDDEPDEPTGKDAYYKDSGPLGAKTSLSLGRRFLGEFNTEDEAFIYLRTLAKYENVFPNVWYISDHGNLILQKDFDWTLK